MAVIPAARRDALNSALTQYITALRRCAAADTHTGNRAHYARHLGAAAKMQAALREPPDARGFETLVNAERRAWGWTFLPGAEGARADHAWNRFYRATGVRAGRGAGDDA